MCHTDPNNTRIWRRKIVHLISSFTTAQNLKLSNIHASGAWSCRPGISFFAQGHSLDPNRAIDRCVAWGVLGDYWKEARAPRELVLTTPNFSTASSLLSTCNIVMMQNMKVRKTSKVWLAAIAYHFNAFVEWINLEIWSWKPIYELHLHTCIVPSLPRTVHASLTTITSSANT